MIDFEAIFGVDDYDPCAALRAMRPAYMALLAGGGEQEIRYRDRATKFAPPDIKAIGDLIRTLEADCAAKNGGPRRRRAVTAVPYRL
jgi:hypothetical protein